MQVLYVHVVYLLYAYLYLCTQCERAIALNDCPRQSVEKTLFMLITEILRACVRCRHKTSVPLRVRQLVTADGGRLVFCYFSLKSRHIISRVPIVWRPAVFRNRRVKPVFRVRRTCQTIYQACVPHTWTRSRRPIEVF